MIAFFLVLLTGVAMFFLTIGVGAPKRRMHSWTVVTLLKVPLFVLLTRVPELIVYSKQPTKHINPLSSIFYGEIYTGVRVFKLLVMLLLFWLSVNAKNLRESAKQ